jgi:xyloglucan-specific exo-beta-1,4-glucanase
MDWLTRPDMKYIGVESIAADPVDSNVVYMAVGTYMGSNGQIIRSADRGDTWTRYNIGVNMGGNADGRSLGERLMVDPNKTSILYFRLAQRGTLEEHGFRRDMGQGRELPGHRHEPLRPELRRLRQEERDGRQRLFDNLRRRGGHHRGHQSLSLDRRRRDLDLGAGTNPPSGMMPHHGVLASDGNLWIAYNSGSGPNSISSGSVWKLNTATMPGPTSIQPVTAAALVGSASRHRTPTTPWPQPSIGGRPMKCTGPRTAEPAGRPSAEMPRTT